MPRGRQDGSGWIGGDVRRRGPGRGRGSGAPRAGRCGDRRAPRNTAPGSPEGGPAPGTRCCREWPDRTVPVRARGGGSGAVPAGTSAPRSSRAGRPGASIRGVASASNFGSPGSAGRQGRAVVGSRWREGGGGSADTASTPIATSISARASTVSQTRPATRRRRGTSRAAARPRRWRSSSPDRVTAISEVGFMLRGSFESTRRSSTARMIFQSSGRPGSPVLQGPPRGIVPQGDSCGSRSRGGIESIGRIAFAACRAPSHRRERGGGRRSHRRDETSKLVDRLTQLIGYRTADENQKPAGSAGMARSVGRRGGSGSIGPLRSLPRFSLIYIRTRQSIHGNVL